MNTSSEELAHEAVSSVSQPERQKSGKPRNIYNCNFRSAGRLSNEDARLLTAMHEGLALHASSALDAYLGISVEVKLDALDQPSIKDHIAELPAYSYIVPLASTAVFLEFENELMFPIIELLLGGTGDALDPGRDLSEIEEEIMQDIVLMIGRLAAVAWKMPSLPVAAGPRIRAAEMHQVFAVNDKATVLRFSVQLSGVTGTFRLVFSTDFLNMLLKQMNRDQPQRKARLWSFPMPPLRERILDCDVEVTAELPTLRVPVRDLIALQPGSVLKLHAPIRNPGMLSTGGHGLFEAAAVRIGSQRAVQLGRAVRSTDRDRR